jgi:4-methyl-5(b-hydroxyethyl)-thiazole monophosphate biosynthesis
MKSKKAVVFLANGFEETEALVPADLLRRAGVEVTLASINSSKSVIGSHNINVTADELMADVDCSVFDLLMLPGGPGHKNLYACERLKDILRKANDDKKIITAICAAPMVIGDMGLLNGEAATCFPGYESYLKGADVQNSKAVVSSNRFVTGRSAAAAIEFGLAQIEALCGEEVKNKVAKEIIF